MHTFSYFTVVVFHWEFTILMFESLHVHLIWSSFLFLQAIVKSGAASPSRCLLVREIGSTWGLFPCTLFAQWIHCSPHCVWLNSFLPHWTVNSSRATTSNSAAIFLQLWTYVCHLVSIHLSWGLKQCMTSRRKVLLSTWSDLVTSISYLFFPVHL